MPEHDRHGGHDHHEPPPSEHQAPGHVAAPVPGGQMHDHHAPPTGGHPERHAGLHEGHSVEAFRRRFWVALLLTLPVLLYADLPQQLLGYTAPTFPGSEYLPLVLGSAVFFYGGLVFLQGAWRELRSGVPGMMTLISLAITVAYLYSLATEFLIEDMALYWELSTLITIMLLGHWLEMRAISGARGALAELAKLLPDTAERLVNGQAEVVALDALRLGDLVLVRPGAKVPADGEVVEGASTLDESMITGESRPVEKGPGDGVVAGTVNEAGALRVRVSKVGGDTALAGIMRLVEEAQQSRSRAQALADRAAFWLTLVAIGAALLTLAVWTALGAPGGYVLRRVVAVLVIACPHALGLAIPLVISISTTLAARHGFLVRDRLALERARELDVVVFDKTGTLTRGEQGVVGVATADGLTSEQALALTAAVEEPSEHAIARAIVAAARERVGTLPRASDFQSLPGRGVRATLDGSELLVGGPRLLESLDSPLPAEMQEQTRTWGEEGKTVVYLVKDQQPQAALALADTIRPESREAIALLRAQGVRVAMLTGDSEAVAQWVARELAIDEYFAQVLPEHKAQKIKELQAGGRRVAMVGDGVNDAPALTQADVGIAIGAGTDVAIESAGIILARDDPRDVPRVIALSRASYQKMVQNLVWATGYNVFAIPAAAGVLAPVGLVLAPAVGAIFMSLSTVIVALNAQLLRRVKL
ncbi:MAG: heavy metal translocating P-type ATPase [Chloroflexota bacterium]